MAAEGRGLESMREKKEQREKECMMPRWVILYPFVDLFGVNAYFIHYKLVTYEIE